MAGPDLERMRAINDAMAALLQTLDEGDPESTEDAKAALAELLDG